MLHLYGCPVGEHDALWLVERLREHDSSDALTAAAIIEKAVRSRFTAIALTPAERSAVLSALEDPPGGLAELRGQLLRHRYSSG